MKNLIKTTTMLLMTLIILGACELNETVIPSTNVSTQERIVGDYNGIQIEATIVADIQYSDSEETIVIEANDNLHQYIEVDYINNSLRIRLSDHINIKNNATLKAHIITGKVIENYSASGASQITLVDSRSANNINLNLSGASSFNGGVTSNSLSISISGASSAILNGETELLQGTLSGASELSDFDMTVDEAQLNLSGASRVSLTINDTIELKASGASTLMYQGTGSTNYLDLSDGAQIIKN